MGLLTSLASLFLFLMERFQKQQSSLREQQLKPGTPTIQKSMKHTGLDGFLRKSRKELTSMASNQKQKDINDMKRELAAKKLLFP